MVLWLRGITGVLTALREVPQSNIRLTMYRRIVLVVVTNYTIVGYGIDNSIEREESRT